MDVNSIVNLALGYAELVAENKALRAEVRNLRSLVNRSRGSNPARKINIDPSDPGYTDEAEQFQAQVPRGSVVRDITPDEPSSLELAAQQLQRNRISRDEE